MFLTQDQEFLRRVLDETRALRRGQALRLLRLHDPDKRPDQLEAALRQMRYLGLIVLPEDDLIIPAELRGEAVDPVMLEAVNVMLDLTGTDLEDLSGRRAPFLLSFLTTLKDGSISAFSILPVPPGRENAALLRLPPPDALHKRHTVIFLLSELSQRERLETPLPHYFALRDGGRLRYFKGGGARRD